MNKARKIYIEINKKVFHLRDGELREIQQKYGAIYRKSLGVPLVSLENIASEYQPSHEVAKLLWDFGGREQTLLAAMLDEPDKTTDSILVPYLLEAKTTELCEQITFRLLRKLSNPKEIINKWLKTDSEVLHIYAILLLGYTPSAADEHIIHLIQKIPIAQNSYKAKVVCRSLLKVGLTTKKNKELLLKILKNDKKFQDLLVELAMF